MRKKTIFRCNPALLLVLAMCLLGRWLGALSLDRLFPQIIDAGFMAQIRENQGFERAMFVTIAGEERILYLRFAGDGYVLRGNLSLNDENRLADMVRRSGVTIFSPLKMDGAPLYRRGTAFSGKVALNGDSQATFVYVPHTIDGRHNDAFVSDLGYLQVNFAENTVSDDLLTVIDSLFSGRAEVAGMVRLNRYYLYRDNYFGPVDAFNPGFTENILFDPLHKATLNKGIEDWPTKTDKDLQLVIHLLGREKFLLSQDMRLKLGIVPGLVQVRWQSLEDTDIGSGQNQLVFLSQGPGINYFDDPWLQTRKNVPCPRLVFHRDVCSLRELQVFPTYSIEPAAKGEGRLRAINAFQDPVRVVASGPRGVTWSSADFREEYYQTVEDALCRGGLLEDSADLAPGFEFYGRSFAGTLINNELRVNQSVSVRDLLTAVIVPAGSADRYAAAYEQELSGTSPHWQFNCGIHYKRVFSEAAISSDKGFRIAWLMLVLRQSHPVYYRLLKIANSLKRQRGYLLLAEKIAAIAAKEGRGFFFTTYFLHFRQLDNLRNQKWLDYLEAYREADLERANRLLQSYKNFYTYLESICES